MDVRRRWWRCMVLRGSDTRVTTRFTLSQGYEWLKYGAEANHYVASTDGRAACGAAHARRRWHMAAHVSCLNTLAHGVSVLPVVQTHVARFATSS